MFPRHENRLGLSAGVKDQADPGHRDNAGMPPDSGSPRMRQLVPRYLSDQFTFTF